MGEREGPGREPRSRLVGFRPGWRRFGESVLLAMICLGVAFLLGNLLLFGYGRDQGIYAVVADGILAGGAPYKAVWDFKPPGIFFVFALAELLFGSSEAAVRILESLLLLSLFPAFAIFSRRHVGGPQAGLLGAAVALLAYVPLEFWYTSQPEGFGGIALAWALVFATCEPKPGPAAARREMAAWGVAASLYAIAALLKPPLGGGILISFALVLVSRRRSRALRGITWFGPPFLAFSLGAALPVVVTLGYFSWKDALPDLNDALFVFAPSYTALGLEPRGILDLLGLTFGRWLLRMTPYTLVGLLPLVLLPSLARRESIGVLHIFGVVAFCLAGIALQAKFFAYHFGAALLLTALPAGWGYWKLWVRVRESFTLCVVTAAVLCLVFAADAPGIPFLRDFLARSALRMQWLVERDNTVLDHLYSLGDVDAGANRRVAEWLRANTPAGSTLYIWGFEPVVYDMANRIPATRYIYNVPQRAVWSRDSSRRVLIEELREFRPAAIVVVHDDEIPWVTGNELDSFDTLQEFPALREMLRTEYVRRATIEDLDIHVRLEPQG